MTPSHRARGATALGGVRSRFIAFAGACVLVCPAAAAEYRWQVAATYAEVETGAVIDADNSSVAATRYFAPVDDQQGPSALAAFFSRSSHLSIGGFDNDERQGIPVTTLGGTAQFVTTTSVLDGYGVTGRYVWRRSGWYAGGGFESADGERRFDFQAPHITDVRGYRVTAGKYLGDSTSLELLLGTNETDTEWGASCSVFLPCITGQLVTADDVALRAFHVGEIGRMSYSLGGGVASTELDYALRFRPPATPPLPPIPPPVGGVVPLPTTLRETASFDFETYSLVAELFPTRRIGVRVGYVRWDGDTQQDDGYDVAATWFFVPRVAARVSFARTVRDIAEIRHTDATALEIFGRF
jgi:hypothetical protein